MNILITGAFGFIGKHLSLKLEDDYKILTYGKEDDDLEIKLIDADVVIHLAGENRPKDESLFEKTNVGLTQTITNLLIKHHHLIPIIFSSSIHIDQHSAYGITKKQAEKVLEAYHQQTNAAVGIFRLPGVFGKWSKPNYNTVVATFCHNVHLNIPIVIDEPNKMIELVYIDDVINEMMKSIHELNGFSYNNVTPTYSINVQSLADRIRSFKSMDQQLGIPNLDDDFTKKLYATFMSFKPTNQFVNSLISHKDDRGSFTELLKQTNFGQVSVNIIKPGISKGDHYHHTKHEKFMVVQGEGFITLRNVFKEELIKIPVSGNDMTSVDIPPGYVHMIENTSKIDMITVMWINEIFDPKTSDTYPKKVLL